MSDEEYNGWSNRETWAINLHLENNYGDYLHMCEAAKEMLKEEHVTGTFAFTGGARAAMARYIQEWTQEVFESVIYPDGDYTPTEEARMFVSDVGSWWRADFYEIAEHWIDEARESLESEAAE